MYSVLVVLLAIVAYHSGIKNPDLAIFHEILAGGKSVNMEKQPVPPSDYFYSHQSDDDDLGIDLQDYENI